MNHALPFRTTQIRLILIIGLWGIIACNNDTNRNIPPNSTFSSFDTIKKELQQLSIDGLEQTNARIIYCNLDSVEASNPNGTLLFVLKLSDSAVKNLDSAFMLKQIFRLPIPDKIFFKLKISDTKNILLSTLLKQYKLEMPLQVDTSLHTINMNNTEGYYYYHELTVYRDMTKSNEKSKETKFVYYDDSSKYLLFIFIRKESNKI